MMFWPETEIDYIWNAKEPNINLSLFHQRLSLSYFLFLGNVSIAWFFWCSSVSNDYSPSICQNTSQLIACSCPEFLSYSWFCTGVQKHIWCTHSTCIRTLTSTEQHWIYFFAHKARNGCSVSLFLHTSYNTSNIIKSSQEAEYFSWVPKK